MSALADAMRAEAHIANRPRQMQRLLDLADLVDELADYTERLRTELAKHGWGDFHYGTQPQDPAIVALLDEKWNLS